MDVDDRFAALAKRRDLAAWHEAAALIRDAGGYRWVGLYEVTATDIGAIAWTGTVAPVISPPYMTHWRAAAGSS